jgi:hypothetical protein
MAGVLAQLFADDAVLPGSINADANAIRTDPHDCDLDVFSDQNPFTRFPRQNQHDFHSFGGPQVAWIFRQGKSSSLKNVFILTTLSK